jgi:colicin import membrane protein
MEARTEERARWQAEIDQATREAEEAERQADEAKRQVNEAKRQADEVKRQADEAKRRAEEAERKLEEVRFFPEFIALHAHLSLKTRAEWQAEMDRMRAQYERQAV